MCPARTQDARQDPTTREKFRPRTAISFAGLSRDLAWLRLSVETAAVDDAVPRTQFLFRDRPLEDALRREVEEVLHQPTRARIMRVHRIDERAVEAGLRGPRRFRQHAPAVRGRRL